MTVEAMSSLPLQAGSAVVAAAGRTALWVISAYMRQPLRNTAVAALVGLSAMAGSNALYKQSHHHPAPLFGTFAEPAPAASTPHQTVMPAERPRQLAEPVSTETTGSLATPADTPQTIGNDDVTMLQQKLLALGLFNGTVDGLFGPRTAKAIKAYEASIGRTPRGLLTPAIVAALRDAEIPAAKLAPAVTAPAVSVPDKVTPAITDQLPPMPTGSVNARSAEPVQVAELTTARPLPAPAPLLAGANPAAVETPVQTASLDVADDAGTPAKALLPTNANTVLKRTVPTIAVHAAPAATATDDAADTQTMPTALAPVTEGADASRDPDVVAAVQRGLNSLGFLHQQVDGVAGEATAKAIRNFEVYYNYDVTGRVTRQLVNLLEQNGAVI